MKEVGNGGVRVPASLFLFFFAAGIYSPGYGTLCEVRRFQPSVNELGGTLAPRYYSQPCAASIPFTTTP